MKEQRFKVTLGESEFFFCDRAFKSAWEQAKTFVERNKGEGVIRVYYRNNRGWGKTWILVTEVIE